MLKNTLLTAIISGAICLVIGFGSGALLTKPDREKTKSAITAIEAKAEKEHTNAQQEIKAAKDEIERLRGEQKSVTIEFEEAKAEIVRLGNELKIITVELEEAKTEISRLSNELKQTNDELALEKDKNILFPPQVTYVLDKDTLKGLKVVGVGVIVENIKPEAEKFGLTTQQLQADVELRLRQNGIRVLSEQERLSTVGKPWLYLNVNISEIENSSLVVYGISLDLNQIVFLERDTTKKCNASTWSIGSMGYVGVSKSKESVREHVKERVDAFINDYLAVNPKE